jgi:proline iminopeptidase
MVFLAMTTNLPGAATNASPFIKEGRLPVTGGQIWYRIAGADKPGIPLLTLHGGPAAPHDYLEPLEALSNGER